MLNKQNLKYAIYVSPESNDKWKDGNIGKIFKNLNYFKNIWGKPHFTLTKFYDFSSDMNCSELINKFYTDFNSISREIKNDDLNSKHFNKNLLNIEDFKNSKIIKNGNLYVLIFCPITFFEIILNKLDNLGYIIKSNKFHITLGEINEIELNPIYKELQNEIKSAIEIDKLTDNLVEYFFLLDWCFSLVKLIDYPSEIVAQYKFD